MSYNWTVMAIRANPDRVLQSIAQYLHKMNGSVEVTATMAARFNRAVFTLFDINYLGWSLIQFGDARCIMPQLIIEVSSTLATRVVTAAEYGVSNYEHFSIVDCGLPEIVYTYNGSGSVVCDQINVDLDALMARGRSDSRWEAHGLERYEKIEKVEYAFHASDVLTLLDCPPELYSFVTSGEAPEEIADNSKNYELKVSGLQRFQLEDTPEQSWLAIVNSNYKSEKSQDELPKPQLEPKPWWQFW